MYVRGIRGATTVRQNDEQQILEETSKLLHVMIEQNQFTPEDIGCVFVTVTGDLDATFPARAIRSMPGWQLVPLMCSLEIPVQNSLPLCIRLMVMVNTERKQDEMIHIYLNEAEKLRPDLVKAAGNK